jgi:hypothetical protein
VYQPNQLSFTQNQALTLATAVVASASATSGATMFGSSLFLQRMYIPGPMNLSEVDMAMSFALTTSATSNAWGSIKRSVGIYSFSNSTKLVSLYSASQGVSWNGSSNTTGAAQNWSICDAAWSAAGGVIVPMTFASTELAPGEYVIGNLLAFSASSTATISLFGAMENTAVTSAVSLNTGSRAMTVGTGTIAVSSYAAGYTPVFFSTNFASLTISSSGTTNTASTAGNLSLLSFSASATSAGQQISLSMASSNSNILSSVSMNSSAVTVNTSTVGVTLATAAPAITVPAFNYLGAGSSVNNAPSAFLAGLMSTGGLPAAITLTTGTANALTTFGSTASNQPWVAMVGA